MKKKLWSGLAVGVMILGMTGVASAGIIVDTGTTGTGTLGWHLDDRHSLAGQFSLSQAYTLTDVDGYIGYGSMTSGQTLTAAIYNDVGSVPGTELFSQQFTVGAVKDWYGASGLNWNLAVGTYWASFEVRTGDTFNGLMLNSAVTPLVMEAFKANGYGWDSQVSTLDGPLHLGVRISGDAAPVPEPATMLLMGTGLAGLISARRKKKD